MRLGLVRRISVAMTPTSLLVATVAAASSVQRSTTKVINSPMTTLTWTGTKAIRAEAAANSKANVSRAVVLMGVRAIRAGMCDFTRMVFVQV